MIESVIVAVAALGVMAWIFGPVRRGEAEVADEGSLLVQEATAKKMSALEAILDMEGERAAGKLSEDDLAVLRAQYETEAVRAMKELSALERDDLSLDDRALEDRALEEEIARMRAGMTCSRCGAPKTGETCDRCHESSA